MLIGHFYIFFGKISIQADFYLAKSNQTKTKILHIRGTKFLVSEGLDF